MVCPWHQRAEQNCALLDALKSMLQACIISFWGDHCQMLQSVVFLTTPSGVLPAALLMDHMPAGLHAYQPAH